MMKKVKQFRFTLMEVTVAFGIFAILVAVLMQFMNTVQRSWNFAEKRARAYAESRMFFDFLDRALQASKGSGFAYDNIEPDKYANQTQEQEAFLRFNSVLPYRYAFYADKENSLYLNSDERTFLDENLHKVREVTFFFVKPDATPLPSDYPPAGTVSISYNDLNGNRKYDEVLSNVISIDFSLFTYNQSQNRYEYRTAHNDSGLQRPHSISVVLKMFSNRNDYETWHSLSSSGTPSQRDNYFREHGFIFNRVFMLPQGN